jgi:hypothetical protein
MLRYGHTQKHFSATCYVRELCYFNGRGFKTKVQMEIFGQKNEEISKESSRTSSLRPVSIFVPDAPQS